MRWRAPRFMTCNSNFAIGFGVPMHPKQRLDRSEDRYESKDRSADCCRRIKFGDRVPELRLSDILDLNTPGDHDMKYFLALFIFSSGVASSNAAALLDKVRLAQTRTFAECIANCNSSNFSSAQNCGLSGSCVAQCTAEGSSCKSRCGEPK
jgi:hypothetical protein